MSRARKISSDLRHVATLAGTTAAVVEGAAIAAEKARSVTEHLVSGGDGDLALAAEVEATLAARPCRRRRRLVLIVVLGLAAAVGITVWKRRAAARRDEIAADLRDEDRFSGSMP
ncbi:MAG: hypothetical protein JST64_01450 [Actinobacteria bacterium]|nr:hypothetical protein [Actinomycetota bacterium]